MLHYWKRISIVSSRTPVPPSPWMRSPQARPQSVPRKERMLLGSSELAETLQDLCITLCWCCISCTKQCQGLGSQGLPLRSWMNR